MGRLDDISLKELQELREQTEGKIPQERVLAAIGRKQGDEIETLAECHGVVKKTIRNWLDRFEEELIKQAPYDAPRPGGPSKLTAEEREQLEEALQQPPTELGYEHQAWSPKFLLHYVKEEFDVEYTGSHAISIARGRAVLADSAASQSRSRLRRRSRVQRDSRKNGPN